MWQLTLYEQASPVLRLLHASASTMIRSGPGIAKTPVATARNGITWSFMLKRGRCYLWGGKFFCVGGIRWTEELRRWGGYDLCPRWESVSSYMDSAWWTESSWIIFGTWILTLRGHTKKSMNEGVVPKMLGFIIYECHTHTKKTAPLPKIAVSRLVNGGGRPLQNQWRKELSGNKFKVNIVTGRHD